MTSRKIITAGATVKVILAKGIMVRPGAQNGDTLYLSESRDGGDRSAPYAPDFDRQMKLADEIMHDDSVILRALSK